MNLTGHTAPFAVEIPPSSVTDSAGQSLAVPGQTVSVAPVEVTVVLDDEKKTAIKTAAATAGVDIKGLLLKVGFALLPLILAGLQSGKSLKQIANDLLGQFSAKLPGA